jgi:chromatin remodeling complex protein RSC6
MSSITSSDNTKMSATVKTSKKTVKSAEPVVAVPVVAAAAAPAAPKATKAKAAKAEAAAPVAAPVVAAAVVAPSPTESAVAAEEDVGASLQKSIADLHEQLTGLKAAFSTAAATLKVVEKQAARLAKKADRRRKRKVEAVEGAEPKPCIFTKPVKISTELCSFLGKPKDTEVSRSAVTKGVMAYARAHNLMDKQTIKADASLRKLLTLNEGDALTILNLQKYLRRHYIKPAPVAA